MQVFTMWPLFLVVGLWSAVQCAPEPQLSFPGPGPNTFPQPWNPSGPRTGPTFPQPGFPGPTFPQPGFPGPVNPPMLPGPTFPRPGTPGWPGSTGPTFPRPTPFTPRFRRSPQGSIQGGVTVPEHGRPQLNVDYNHKIIDNGRSTLNGFGGVSSPDFKHFQPHAGVNYEYRPNNDFFVRGQGSVQPLPGGRFDPQVGVGLGWRFR